MKNKIKVVMTSGEELIVDLIIPVVDELRLFVSGSGDIYDGTHKFLKRVHIRHVNHIEVYNG